MKSFRMLFLFLILSAAALNAAEISKEEAVLAVKGWLKSTDGGFGQRRGNTITDAESYTDDSGNNIFYKVDLGTNGFVVTSADDEFEPIITFSNESSGNIQKNDPLYAMLSNDPRCKVPSTTISTTRSISPSKQKWQKLIEDGSLQLTTRAVYSSVSDMRIAPLLKTKWSQSTVKGYNYYNYYTPNHYVCGCVATAMAQLMYYHKYPQSGIGRVHCSFTVNGSEESAYTLGGNGSGGGYDWENMPENPNSISYSSKAAQAIGRLCYDAGIAAKMQYTSGESGATLYSAASALKSVFRYSNYKGIHNRGYSISSEFLNNFLCSNLDAKLPLLLGIKNLTSNAGHAVICDGYGYINSGTLYHHLNMGWSGYKDLWYNMPDIESGQNSYDSVIVVVGNIYTSGTGAVISGRVLDEGGHPIEGAMVVCAGQISTTDSKGIYAFSKVPSGTQTFKVSKVFYDNKSVSKTISLNSNTWGFDIVLSGKPDLTPYQPSGWSDKIVLSTTIGTHSDSTIYNNSQIYVDLAISNDGNGKSPESKARLYLDDTILLDSFTVPATNPGQYRYWEDATSPLLSNLSFGEHTLKLIVDSESTVDELGVGELNNEYTKTFNVIPNGLHGEIISVTPESFVGGQSQTVRVKYRSYKLGYGKNYFLDCYSLPTGWTVNDHSYNGSHMDDDGTVYSHSFTVKPPASGGRGTITWKFYDDGWGGHPSGSKLLDSYSQPVSATNSLPGTVSGLTATTGAVDGCVNLKWNSAVNASDYYVYYSQSSSVPSSETKVGVVTSKTITGLVPGKRYYFWVRTKNSYGYSSYSLMTSAVAKLSIPSTPMNLSAVKGSNEGEVNVSWTKSSRASSYKVYYEESSNGAPFNPLRNGSPRNGSDVGNVSSVTIKFLTPGTRYYFSVKAINSAGESNYAPSVSQIVKKNPPAAPAYISAQTGTNEGEVRLSWASSPEATSYSVYYDEDSSNGSGFQPEVNGLPSSSTNIGNVTSKVISGLTPGATYYFSVKAHSVHGSSDFAVQKSTKVKINPHLVGTLSDKVSNYDDGAFIYYFPKSVFVADTTLSFTVTGLPGNVSDVYSSGENWYFVWSFSKTLLTTNRNEAIITALDRDGHSVSDKFIWWIEAGQPTIKTGDFKNLGDRSATLKYYDVQTKLGGYETMGFELSTDPNMMNRQFIDSSFWHEKVVSELERGTTYYYRAKIFTMTNNGVNRQRLTGYGKIKSFTTTFTFNKDKISQIETLKEELVAGGIDNILDGNLELYQEGLIEHFDYVGTDSDFVQNIIDAVNSGVDYVVWEFVAGWSLISPPFADVSLSEFMSTHPQICSVFNYDTQSYHVCENDNHGQMILKYGRGYWVFSLDKCALVVTKKSTSEYTAVLRKGWNLVGPPNAVSFDDLCNLFDGRIYDYSCWGWNPLQNVYQRTNLMELGKGYWLKAAEDAEIIDD